MILVATKCDLRPGPTGEFATSAVTGLGVGKLKKAIFAEARKCVSPGLAPSLSRCRHHIEACIGHLRSAHAIVLNDDPPEMLALELRSALEHLGEMTGAIYTEELLDRIFSRFCIGK
jgi:tRNA modification GTPase